MLTPTFFFLDDTGNWFRNFSSVLGARWWLWLSPLVSAPGTGTEFEISSKVIEIAKQRQRESSAAQNSSSVIDDTIVVVWPPVEYSRYKSDPNYINTVKKNGVTVGGSGGGGGNAGVLGNRRSGKEIQLDRYLDRNDQQDSSSGSDEEEPNDRASTGGRGGDSSGGRRRKNRHVRRGSEGYIVKEYTDEDRQRMLRAAQLHDKAEAGLDSFSSGSSSSSDVGVVDSSSSDEDATPLNSVKDRLLRNKNRNEVGKTVER